MLVRRLSAGALCFLASISIVSSRVSSETGDKQLARVKGVVGYQDTATSDFKPIFGRLDLPDDAYAVTKPNGSAVLRLKDSSEIDIGENTKVQVGAFNPAESGNVNTIALNGGALHFNIRHPQGGQSNYKFVTATSQIAVRGTEGFLIAGANGTQVSVVSGGVGDVTVQVGNQSISVLTNQTLTVLGTNPLSATTTLTANTGVNNPAINQFNNNSNPFTTNSTGTSLDPTGSASGIGSGAGTAGIAGTTTAVAGAAAGAAVVATVAKPGSSPAPAPSNAPGTLAVQIDYPGATTFPYSFQWPFSQLNATGQATFTCSPSNIITCNVTQNSPTSGATLNGIVTGQLLAAGSFTIGGNASGYVLSPTTFAVYGAVSSSLPSMTFGETAPLPSHQNLTITQAGATSITATVTCPSAGASVSLSNATGPSPLTIVVTANSAPSGTSGQPCVITAAGQGDGSLASISVPVNVTASNVTITSRRRKQ